MKYTAATWERRAKKLEAQGKWPYIGAYCCEARPFDPHHRCPVKPTRQERIRGHGLEASADYINSWGRYSIQNRTLLNQVVANYREVSKQPPTPR